MNSLNFEALIGDKAVRMDNKYRIEFTMNTDIENPILTICNIVEHSIPLP